MCLDTMDRAENTSTLGRNGELIAGESPETLCFYTCQKNRFSTEKKIFIGQAVDRKAQAHMLGKCRFKNSTTLTQTKTKIPIRTTK